MTDLQNVSPKNNAALTKRLRPLQQLRLRSAKRKKRQQLSGSSARKNALPQRSKHVCVRSAKKRPKLVLLPVQ
jgi:hypothetical protein